MKTCETRRYQRYQESSCIILKLLFMSLHKSLSCRQPHADNTVTEQVPSCCPPQADENRTLSLRSLKKAKIQVPHTANTPSGTSLIKEEGSTQQFQQKRTHTSRFWEKVDGLTVFTFIYFTFTFPICNRRRNSAEETSLESSTMVSSTMVSITVVLPSLGQADPEAE